MNETALPPAAASALPVASGAATAASEAATAASPEALGIPPDDVALERFRAQVISATERGAPLIVRGGGTKDWYGEAPVGDLLDTSGYSGIVAYDPAELVITARCGTPLAEIEALLASHHQMLPFEPPHFGARATFGGCIAAGLAGPRRASAGAARDFVLGAVVMNGLGKVLHFGGQVMKNVAGYDVARLMAGSLGTLGLILELSIKVLPRPVADSSVRFEMSATDAIRKLNEWGGRPLPVSGSAWRDNVLTVRFEGAQAAVKAARVTLGGEFIDAVEAIRFWDGLREHTDPFFNTAGGSRRPLWRVAVPPITESLPLPAAHLIEWGGGQRWWHDESEGRSGEAPAGSFGQAVRHAAQQCGGHATLFRDGSNADGADGADGLPAARRPGAPGIFTPAAPAIMSIHRGLKAAFDPARIFNRGRLYPDF